MNFRLWWAAGAVIFLAAGTSRTLPAQTPQSGAQLEQVHSTSSTNSSSAATSDSSAAGVKSATPVQAGSYVIGAGDVLMVNVYNEPEVTGKMPVRPDGMISVPLVGDVQASGVTTERLQATLTQKLTEFVRQPSVTVVVEEMNSRQFNVMGQVQHPGSFPLTRPTHVMDALAQAGGFAEFAKTKKVYVLRRDANGNSVKLPFDYKRVSQGNGSDIQLQSGDTVIVP
jgi:polysaccharide biosynthesis/export protein